MIGPSIVFQKSTCYLFNYKVFWAGISKQFGARIGCSLLYNYANKN